MFLSSLFLIDSRSKEDKRMAYTGVEGLFALWRESMSMYRTAIEEFGFSYPSFAEDFINSRTWSGSNDAASMNDHAVNLGRIRRLLKYENVVRKYSLREWTETNFVSCMDEILRGHYPSKDIQNKDFQCRFSRNAISEITKAVNGLYLFSKAVTDDEMNELFNICEPKAVPMFKASVNQHVAYFFSQMDFMGLICHNYQQVIEDNRLICSSASDSPLSAHNLAQSLDRINNSINPVKAKITESVRRIKAAYLSDSSTEKDAD